MQITTFNEGDYIQTKDGLFFTVKGSQHPEGLIIAYLRYLPDPYGDRIHDSLCYRRVTNLAETTKLLQSFYPQYLNNVSHLGLTLQTVPVRYISRVFSPKKKLQEMMIKSNNPLEKICVDFIGVLIKESGVSSHSFGVTGSTLIGMSNEKSDVDILVYGSDSGDRVYETLKKIRKPGGYIEPYTCTSVIQVAKQRWAETGVELTRFLDVETQKILHGRVSGKDYFIRLIRKFDNFFSSEPVRTVGFRGRVLDSSQSIFTPATYSLEEVELIPKREKFDTLELLSYRGKFTEQVSQDELVEGRGMLEKVSVGKKLKFRIILGDDSHYLIPSF